MRKRIALLISIALKQVGLRFCKVEEYNPYPQKYIESIREMHGCFSELIFPELPPSDLRIDLLSQLIGTQISEGMYILQFLHKSLKLEGDICEFGVAQGATSALLANEIRATQKNLWLFDSFEGLPKPTAKDILIDDISNLGSIDRYEGTMRFQVDVVKSRLKKISFPFSRVRIVPGFIEHTVLSENLPEKVCFAYIDFDFYNPTMVALKFLDERLSIGGFAVVDDYGFFHQGLEQPLMNSWKPEQTIMKWFCH
jgi:O-methyltransferase